MIDLNAYIDENTLRLEASHRGGGIELDLAPLTGIDGLKCAAYQNYLGGGMTGSVGFNCNFDTSDTDLLDQMTPGAIDTINVLAEFLPEYYYNITNDEVLQYDEWAASDSFAAQQARPESAY